MKGSATPVTRSSLQEWKVCLRSMLTCITGRVISKAPEKAEEMAQSVTDKWGKRKPLIVIGCAVAVPFGCFHGLKVIVFEIVVCGVS